MTTELALSSEVIADIKTLVNEIDVDTPNEVSGISKSDSDYEEENDYMQLTVACDEKGRYFNYQTGDNSYTGGAYGLPHWAVVYIGHDTNRDELATEIINELTNLINEW